MEYVVYLSKNKIDMLYDQISWTDDETETEGEIKLGFFTIKRSRKKDNTPNRFKKLERVTSALTDRIGSPFEEKIPSYITDTFTMSWRTLTFTKQATYWIGEGFRNDKYVKLLLIGSTRNVIGEETDSSDPVTHSALMHFLNAFRKDFEIPDNGYSETVFRRVENEDGRTVERLMDAKDLDASEMMDILFNSSPEGQTTFVPYKFLAKVLSTEERQGNYGTERYIIATPLYVSLAEEQS